MIMDNEKQIQTAHSSLDAAESKETKLRKELNKSLNKRNSSNFDIGDLELKVSAAERAKNDCKLKLDEITREMAVVKMIIVKGALVKMSKDYMNLANKCGMIFSASQSIARNIPDVDASNVNDVEFTADDQNKRIVSSTKDILESLNTTSMNSSSHLDDKPPPYSLNPPPENPYLYSADSSFNSSFNNSIQSPPHSAFQSGSHSLNSSSHAAPPSRGSQSLDSSRHVPDFEELQQLSSRLGPEFEDTNQTPRSSPYHHLSQRLSGIHIESYPAP